MLLMIRPLEPVNAGRVKLVKLLLVMAKEPVVLTSCIRLTEEQLLMAMLPAVVRLPKVATAFPAALAFKLRPPDNDVNGMLMSGKYWLLAMVIPEAVVKLIPLRFWRKVS